MEALSDITKNAQSAFDAGGNGPSATLITVTVPWPGRIEHEETVAVAGLTGSENLAVSLAAHADIDENAADMLSIAAMSAVAGVNEATILLGFGEPTSGPIKLLIKVI